MHVEQLVMPENEQDFLERQANILKSLDPISSDSKPSVDQPKIPEHKSPSKDKSDYQAKIARLLVVVIDTGTIQLDSREKGYRGFHRKIGWCQQRSPQQFFPIFVDQEAVFQREKKVECKFFRTEI
jgi:hypothetical protein